MAKINTGTITADANGNWTSDAINMGIPESKTVYMRVNGMQVLTRTFTVAPPPAPTFGSFFSSSTNSVAVGNNASLANVSAPANSLVIVGIQPSNGAGSNVTISAVTVNGNAAAQKVRQVGPSGFPAAEIWTYFTTAALTNVTVLATVGTNTGDIGLWAVPASGTNSSSAGATNGANGTSGTGAVSVVTTAENSVIVASIANWASAALTAGANTANFGTFADNNARTAGAYNTEDTASGNSYTVTETFTSSAWAAAALEIKPGS
jgi:hypothetical protein